MGCFDVIYLLFQNFPVPQMAGQTSRSPLHIDVIKLLPILIGKPLAIIARVYVNLDTFFVQSTTNRIRRPQSGTVR